jgi:hypothetical protein
VTNNTAVSLTVDYAVMSLISPSGAVQSTPGGWQDMLPEPYPAAITLAPGQTAEYIAGGLYAVGQVGDTAELAFWTEYSSFPHGVVAGAGNLGNAAEYSYSLFRHPPSMTSSTFPFAHNACTRRILHTRRRQTLGTRSSAALPCSI